MSPEHLTAGDVESAVMAVARGLRRGWAESISHTGLAPHQARALRVIAGEGPIRPGVLAERLRITPRSVTEVADALIREGLVDRQLDPSDRRAMILELTDSGRALAHEISRCRRAHTDQLLSGALSKDEEATLVELLGKVTARLDADRP